MRKKRGGRKSDRGRREEGGRVRKKRGGRKGEEEERREEG